MLAFVLKGIDAKRREHDGSHVRISGAVDDAGV